MVWIESITNNAGCTSCACSKIVFKSVAVITSRLSPLLPKRLARIAVCASPERCAVDIEPATRDFRRAASRYLTPEEEALSDDPLLPGIVWCAKETLYKYAGRRELDFRRDLHVVRLDLAAGTLAGRIGNGEPVRLSVSLDEGFILVYIL